MKITKFLVESPTFALIYGGQEIQRRVSSRFKPYGLNVLEGLILVSLFFEEKQTARPKSLQKAFQTTKANISHCTSKLESKKYIKRSSDPKDRRSYDLTLTKSGEAAALKLISYFDSLQNSLEKSLKTSVFLASLRKVQQLHH